jgi:hypothetical protein
LVLVRVNYSVPELLLICSKQNSGKFGTIFDIPIANPILND